MQNVAIFHNIPFSLSAHLARFFGPLFAGIFHVILVGYRFCANKAAFEIAVDYASRAWGKSAGRNCPGAGFFRTNGEVGFQVQQIVAGADQAVQPCFFQTHFTEEEISFFAVELADFFFDLGTDHYVGCALCAGHFCYAGGKFVAGCGAPLINVANVKHRLCGEKLEQLPGALILFIHLDHARGLAIFKCGQCGAQKAILLGGLFIPAAQLAHQPLKALFDAFDVGEHQLGFDNFGILNRIDPAFHMGNIAIFKAAQHVGDGIHFADICEKLVAQPFAFAGAFYKAGDVYKRHPGWNDLRGIRDLCQSVEARIGHGHIPDIRFNGAEREICGLGGCGFGERIEKGGFPHIWQTYDAHFEAHARVSFAAFSALLCVEAKVYKGVRAGVALRFGYSSAIEYSDDEEMYMSRIDSTFAQLREDGKKAFVAYIMAGDPNYARSLEIMRGLPGAGVDVIELGLPFTDPMADGPTIQLAGQRALESGQTLEKTLQMVRAFREEDGDTPIVLMGYYNPIHARGVERFLVDAKAAGIDGLIVVDLPPEEDAELCLPAQAEGLNFIRLATPTTDDARLPVVMQNTSGFVYYVSITGITGAQAAQAGDVAPEVARIKGHTDLPVIVGFGITTPQAAGEIAAVADGCVVGSAIVAQIAEGKPASEVLSFVADLAAGAHS